jgi:hypothetical protein
MRDTEGWDSPISRAAAENCRTRQHVRTASTPESEAKRQRTVKRSVMNTLNYSTQTTARVLADVLNDFLADDGKLNGMIAPMLEQTALAARRT